MFIYSLNNTYSAPISNLSVWTTHNINLDLFRQPFIVAKNALYTFSRSVGKILKADSTGNLLVNELYQLIQSPTVDNDDNHTYTVDEFRNGFIIREGLSQARTDTFHTAANLIGAISNAADLSAFKLTIKNKSPYTLSFAAGTGATIEGANAIGTEVTLYA